MSVTLNAGKTRRTLAEQLDRLDGILGNLTGDLSAAVAAAVKEATGVAVQEAVRQALVEVLTNPEVLTLLGSAAQAHVSPAADPEPTVFEDRPGLRDHLGAVGSWTGRQVRAARAACGRAAEAGRRCLGGVGVRLVPLWQIRRKLLVALGIGVAAGCVVYLAGPWLGTVLTGLATFTSSLLVQARQWMRRLVGEQNIASAAT